MSHCGYTNNCVCTTGFCLGPLISSLVLSFGLRLVQPLARGVASCLLTASSNPELDPVQTREVAPTTADTWLQLRSPRKSTHSDRLGSGLGWSLSVPCPLTVTWGGWLFLKGARPKAQWFPCVLFTPIWLGNLWNPSMLWDNARRATDMATTEEEAAVRNSFKTPKYFLIITFNLKMEPNYLPIFSVVLKILFSYRTNSIYK